MANNKLSDLKDHLFCQLERLNDESITEAELEIECKKAKAITSISAQINKASALVLQATKLVASGTIPTENEKEIKTKLLS